MTKKHAWELPFNMPAYTVSEAELSEFKARIIKDSDSKKNLPMDASSDRRLCVSLFDSFDRLYRLLKKKTPASLPAAMARAKSRWSPGYTQAKVSTPLATVLCLIEREQSNDNKDVRAFIQIKLSDLDSIVDYYGRACAPGAQERLEQLCFEVLAGSTYGIQAKIRSHWDEGLKNEFLANTQPYNGRERQGDIHTYTKLVLRAEHQRLLPKQSKGETCYAKLSDTSSGGMKRSYERKVSTHKKKWKAHKPLMELSIHFLQSIKDCLIGAGVFLQTKGEFPFLNCTDGYLFLAKTLLPVFKEFLSGGATIVNIASDIEGFLIECIVDIKKTSSLPFYEYEGGYSCWNEDYDADTRLPLYFDWEKRVRALFIISAQKVLNLQNIEKRGALSIPFTGKPYIVQTKNFGRKLLFPTNNDRGDTRPITLQEPLTIIMRRAGISPKKIKLITESERNEEANPGYYLKLVPSAIMQIIQAGSSEEASSADHEETLEHLFQLLCSRVTPTHSYCYILLNEIRPCLSRMKQQDWARVNELDKANFMSRENQAREQFKTIFTFFKSRIREEVEPSEKAYFDSSFEELVSSQLDALTEEAHVRHISKHVKASQENNWEGVQDDLASLKTKVNTAIRTARTLSDPTGIVRQHQVEFQRLCTAYVQTRKRFTKGSNKRKELKVQAAEWLRGSTSEAPLFLTVAFGRVGLLHSAYLTLRHLQRLVANHNESMAIPTLQSLWKERSQSVDAQTGAAAAAAHQ